MNPNFELLINSLSQPVIRDRGRRLQKLGKVDIIDKDFTEPNTMAVSAIVLGTSIYKVTLNLKEEVLDAFSCTCPYDWGGICKHTVAVLYQLNDDQKQQREAKTKGLIKKASDLKLRNTKDPYEVDIKDGQLDFSAVTNSIEFREVQREFWSYTVEYKVDGEQLVFFVSKKAYGGWQSKDEKHRVTVAKQGDKMLISSEPHKNVAHLTHHECAALFVFINNEVDYLFFLLNKEDQEEAILEEATRYGIIDIDEAKKYFEVSFDIDSESLVVSKPGSPKLVALGDNGMNLSGIDFSLHEETQLALSVSNRRDDRELFFCIGEDEGFSRSEVLPLSVVPFLGRLKKNGELYANGLKKLVDLDWHDKYQVESDKEELVKKSLRTSTEDLDKRYGKLARGASDDSAQQFLLSENLAALQAVWQEMMINDISPYLNKDPNSYRLGQDELKSGYEAASGLKIVFSLGYKDGLYVLQPSYQVGRVKYKWTSNHINRFHPLLTVVNKQLHLSNSVREVMLLSLFAEGGFAAIESNFGELMTNIVMPVSKVFQIDFKNIPDTYKYEKVVPSNMKKTIYLKELDNFILIQPRVEYEDIQINILEEERLLLAGKEITEIQRDLTFEKDFLQFLTSSHPKFENNHFQTFYNLNHKEFIHDYWFLDFVEKCEQNNIEVFGFNEFKKLQYAPHRAQVNVNASSGEDWFDLEVNITIGDERVSLKDVQKAILSKDKYIKLGNGKLGLLPKEWVEKLEKYFRIGKVNKDGVKISKFSFNAMEEVFEELDQHQIVKEIVKKKKRLSDFDKISQQPIPDEINAELRDYQKQGYDWLRFLHEFGWGGILADDMGLGKTIQMITFLKSLVDEGVKNHLVIVPTSLLFNWKKEIDKFCPSLTYMVHHGSGRKKEIKELDDINIVLTSYGILVSDFKFFKDKKFDYIVLDESQAIKNPTSKRFKAAMSLQSANRVVMTGTPVENNTFDLYAQMTFVNPGCFISIDHFRKNYANAIDKEGNTQAAVELNRMIKPFILRRTKELVATELPPKIEDVIYCEMGDKQRKVYDAYRNEYRNEIMGMIENNELESSRLHVLQALTKLRQICNSPAILQDDATYDNESVKIEELIRHIKEKTGNHKILIFSQFVSMLGLIKRRLVAENISYAYLDGKTTQKNRERAVTNFQTDEGIRVFLISLKAGGTGLNLTAADYVYIVDPWWNPAVENQAIDRCYRIGQDKKVIAYRMICKDTLEEKIMSYKSKKQSVADSIIKTDESIMKKIDKQEILSLFS